ncbi:hypothetical protein ACOAKC_05510 [Hathewaya histolytica]|uniref:hypothetical protein n=1 Tax=Hathewaya histolytica TaxID=1498 RepID=UPI003B678637
MNKIKIKISEEAYDRLLKILDNHKEYNYLRLSKGSCCKNKVSLTLDNKNSNDIEDSIEDLKIVYTEEISDLCKEIVLVFREGSFMIKVLQRDTSKSFCGGCNKSKKSCKSCSGCSGCNKN